MVIPDGTTFLTLVNFTGFTIWLFYAAMFLAVIVLRFRVRPKRKTLECIYCPLIYAFYCA